MQGKISINKCSKIQVINNSKIYANQKFEIILANINKNTILENFSSFQENLIGNGVLLLSGFLNEDLPEFLLDASDFDVMKRITKDDWICLGFMPCV